MGEGAGNGQTTLKALIRIGNSDEVRRNAKIQLAIAMYREGKWSTGKSAEFAGMYLGHFMDLLKDRGICRPYSERMLEQDIAYARGRG